MERLQDVMQKYRGAAIAFTGGADSGLLAACCKAWNIPCLLLTASSPLIPDCELEIARRIARELELPWEQVAVDSLSLPEVAENRHQRCYHCKRQLLDALRKTASERGFSVLLEGSNADDTARPGMQAAKELGIPQPLAEAALTKAEVRALGRELGLSSWDRPAAPCLATRFPYDTHLTPAMLRQAEQGEAFLRTLGFSHFRLRVHGDLARLELDEGEQELLPAKKEEVRQGLSALGFAFVTLDLAGLCSGCYDAKNGQKHQMSSNKVQKHHI